MPLIQNFGKNIWIVDGPKVKDMGFMFPTRMTIIRLSNDKLWISSPIPIKTQTLKKIKSLGKLSYLVVGTPRHLWRLESWNKKFPELKLWGPPQINGNFITKSVLVGKADLPFEGVLSNNTPDIWSKDIEQIIIEGNPFIKEVAFLHKKSKTLILDDLIQRYPIEKNKKIRNAFLKFEDMLEPNGGVPKDIRLTFTNKEITRKSIDKILKWNFNKLIIAHGKCIDKDAKSFVRNAFNWLRD